MPDSISRNETFLSCAQGSIARLLLAVVGANSSAVACCAALLENAYQLTTDNVALWHSRQDDGHPSEPSSRCASEMDKWVDEGKRDRENALRANLQDLLEQYEKQRKGLEEAYGEAMLELRARNELQSLLGEDEK